MYITFKKLYDLIYITFRILRSGATKINRNPQFYIYKNLKIFSPPSAAMISLKSTQNRDIQVFYIYKTSIDAKKLYDLIYITFMLFLISQISKNKSYIFYIYKTP